MRVSPFCCSRHMLDFKVHTNNRIVTLSPGSEESAPLNVGLGLAPTVTGSLLVMIFETAGERGQRVEAGADRDFLQLQVRVDHHAARSLQS